MIVTRMIVETLIMVMMEPVEGNPQLTAMQVQQKIM
jgi:hypothetical protein